MARQDTVPADTVLRTALVDRTPGVLATRTPEVVASRSTRLLGHGGLEVRRRSRARVRVRARGSRVRRLCGWGRGIGGSLVGALLGVRIWVRLTFWLLLVVDERRRGVKCGGGCGPQIL